MNNVARQTLNNPGVCEQPTSTISQDASPSVVSAKPKEITLRATEGIAWSILASIAAQGGSFVSSVILARIIGAEQFGKFALIQSTVIAVTTMSGLGLGVTATKYVSQYRSTEPNRAGLILGLSVTVALLTSLLFGIGLVALAPWLATDSSLVPELRLSAAFVFFVTMNGYQVGALAGLEAFRRVATVSIIYGPATVFITWLMASSYGLRGAVLSQGASSLLLWLLYQFALRNHCREARITIRYRGAWKERSALFRFSIPATLSGITGSLAIWACSLFLVKESGYAQLAIFSAANNLRLMVIFLPTLVARVTSPIMNNLLVVGDRAQYRRIFWGAIIANGGVALLIAIVLSIAGQQFLRVFGKDFVGSSTLIVLLLGSTVIEVVACNLCQAIFTSGSLWWQVAINLAWTVVLVSLSMLTIQRRGAVGLAMSYLAAWCISAVLYAAVGRLLERKSAQQYTN